ERIKEFVYRNGTLLRITLREVVALEHPRDRVLRRELDHSRSAELVAPRRVEHDLRAIFSKHLEDLRLVRLRVLRNLLRRERGTRRIASARVADQSGEIADEKHDVVPQVLELAHLVQHDGVSEMQIGRGGIEP